MATTQAPGMQDVTYDLISVIYHALQGAQTYQKYEGDAKESGDQELASFFSEAQQMNWQIADRAKSLLGNRLDQGSSR